MSNDLDQFQHHSLITSMFFPQSRLMVMGNPKAAGTSLRWWLLPLHGVDVDALTRRSLWKESAPYQTVWDTGVDLRYTWNNLDDAQRQDAMSSTDVMTVHPVRHPVTRAFSAWSGKYLNAEPYYSERLPESVSAPVAHVESPQQVADLFEKFIISLAAHVREHAWLGLDVHFWPQHLLLGRRPAGTVLVLRQESITEGLAAVHQHLASHGLSAGPPPRINETIVPYQPQLVTEAALAAVALLYADDILAWDYEPTRPEARPREVDLDWLNDVRGRNQRYGVIHRAAMHGERRERELLAELSEARQREQDLFQSTSWKLTRPIRAMSGALHRGRPPQ